MATKTDSLNALSENIEGRLSAGFGVVLAVLVLIVVAAIRNSLKSVETSDWVNHTHAVILEADAILSSLHAAESAHRSFLITEESRDQAAYRTAFGDVSVHLDVALALTAQDTSEHEHTQLVKLAALVAKRVEFARTVVETRAEKGLEAARQLLIADSGMEVAREIKQMIGQLIAEENSLLLQHDQAMREHDRTTRWILFIGLGLNFLLIGFLFWLIRLDLTLRRRAATALYESNVLLEERVRERTVKLEATVESLEVENLERRWAQEASQRLNRHNELVINSITDGIIVISRRTTILRVNPSMVHLGGWNEKELFGMAIDKVVRLTPESTASGRTHAEILVQSMKEGANLLGLKANLIRRDGGVTPVRYNSHPIRDKDKVVGTVVTITPVA